MPLVSIPQLMTDCQAGGYAVGYFESWNLESLQGVLDAAEQTRSPVIVGFNGEFLSHAGRLASERLALYGCSAGRPPNRRRYPAASSSMNAPTTHGSSPPRTPGSISSCPPTRVARMTSMPGA